MPRLSAFSIICCYFLIGKLESSRVAAAAATAATRGANHDEGDAIPSGEEKKRRLRSTLAYDPRSVVVKRESAATYDTMNRGVLETEPSTFESQQKEVQNRALPFADMLPMPVMASDLMEQVAPYKGSRPRNIFACGVWFTGGLKMLFPHWEGRFIQLDEDNQLESVEELVQKHHVTEDDLVFGHLHRADSCIKNISDFPGKVLLFNPEPEDDWPNTPRPTGEVYDEDVAVKRKFDYLPPSEHIYVIGPHGDSERSVHVFPAIFYFFKVGHAEARLTKLMNRNFRIAAPGHRPPKGFMVYIQSHYVQERELAVQYLTKILYSSSNGQLQLAVGGRCQGNPQRREQKTARTCLPVDNPQQRREIENIFQAARKREDFMLNASFMQQYRFTLSFENTNRDGYVTEKILHAFLSGSVPIYWGTRDVFKLFNEKAFIYYDIANPKEAINQILRLESDPQAYQEMAQQPVFANGWETVEEYFSLSDSIGGGKLRERIMDMLGYDPRFA